MNLSWMQSIFYGLVVGASEVLPVSSRAHSQMLLKLLGESETALMALFIHAGIALALYFSSQAVIVRVMRALALARIPKRRRKRPLDTKSLMDFRLWRTTLLPAILFFAFYGKVKALDTNLVIVSAFVLFNGLVLYLPQFFPGCNKDARTLSRVDGLLMGLGMGLGVFPGVSGVGVSVSIGSICGVDRNYCVNLALLTDLAAVIVLIVHDVLNLMSVGVGVLSFVVILRCLLMALMAFAGCRFAVRLMRKLASANGFGGFAYYCWGVALLVFILNLLA